MLPTAALDNVLTSAARAGSVSPNALVATDAALQLFASFIKPLVRLGLEVLVYVKDCRVCLAVRCIGARCLGELTAVELIVYHRGMWGTAVALGLRCQLEQH